VASSPSAAELYLRQCGHIFPGCDIDLTFRHQLQVFGMVEENTPEGNVLVNRHIRAGQTIHIPQGIQHFSHNPTCQGAQFLANFATADPGATCLRVVQCGKSALQFIAHHPISCSLNHRC
jgi:hypothetical protein